METASPRGQGGDVMDAGDMNKASSKASYFYFIGKEPKFPITGHNLFRWLPHFEVHYLIAVFSMSCSM